MPGSKDTPTDDGSNGPQIPSHMLYQNNAELGDLDTAEDSIDGMGAIKFTDEEDCGYFGTHAVPQSSLLVCSAAC